SATLQLRPHHSTTHLLLVNRTQLPIALHPYVYLIHYQAPAHNQDLHSFPTRRSSDLLRIRGPGFSSTKISALRAWIRDSHRSARSEEHTSELQSPYDIVCRLLLEKKKPNLYRSINS